MFIRIQNLRCVSLVSVYVKCPPLQAFRVCFRLGISAMKSANTCPFFYSLGWYWMSYSLVRLPSEPFCQRSQAYGVCSGEECRLALQWGVPRNMGRVS